jgi:hypothetical protein
MIGLGLGINLSALRSGTAVWLPIALFESGEQGAWYDPSDLTSMRQLSTGATAAAVASPVGFIADKRLMGGKTFDAFVAGQPELAIDAHFNNPLAWTTTANTSVSGGGASFNAPTVNGDSITPSTAIGLVPNTYYEFTFTIVNYVSGSVRVETVGGGSVSIGNSVGANGTFTQILQAVGANNSFRFRTTTTNADLDITSYSVKAIPGNHATQATAAARPILRQDGALYYLEFDGVDDSLATASIDFSATDEMSVFAGVRKLSDAAQGMLVELSANAGSNNGAFFITAPNNAGTGNYAVLGRGSTTAFYLPATYSAPITNVVAALYDISGATIADQITPRINGVVDRDAPSGTMGTGNFGNYPLYIGRRASASSPLNGRIYSLIVRGALTSGDLLTATETYVADETGVTI